MWEAGDGWRQAAVDMSVQDVDVCNANAKAARERVLALSYLYLSNVELLENINIICLDIV